MRLFCFNACIKEWESITQKNGFSWGKGGFHPPPPPPSSVAQQTSICHRVNNWKTPYSPPKISSLTWFSSHWPLKLHLFVSLFLGGHHLYMNLCMSVCLSVCVSVQKTVRFSVPPFHVHFSVPPRWLGHRDSGTLGYWDTETLGHWATGTPGHCNTGWGAGAHLPQPCCDFLLIYFKLG